VKGEDEVVRELRHYITAVRVGLGAVIVALVSLPFIIKLTVVAPATLSWQMGIDAGVWVAGLVTAFWGRSRMYALRREWAVTALGAQERETPS